VNTYILCHLIKKIFNHNNHNFLQYIALYTAVIRKSQIQNKIAFNYI